MIESLEQIRKHADMCTRMAGGEDGFETVWMTKRAFLDDLDAIERQPKESQHWHSPRRDAWHDVERHRHLFTMHGEIEAIKERLETFE